MKLNIQLPWFPNNLDHLASLQSQYTMQLNASGNDIQTSSSVQHHKGTQTRSQASSEFPRGEETYFYHFIHSSGNHVLSQDFGLHLLKVPSLLRYLSTQDHDYALICCVKMTLYITTADFKTNRHLTIISTRSRLRSDLLREDGTTSKTDSSIVLTWLQHPLTNGRHLEATASPLFNEKHL